MSIFSGFIDDVMDWWTGDDIIGDVIGAASGAFLGGGGESDGTQKRPLRERVSEGLLNTTRVRAPGGPSSAGVTETNEYFNTRDEWRARLRRAQDFADTSPDVISPSAVTIESIT